MLAVLKLKELPGLDLLRISRLIRLKKERSSSRFSEEIYGDDDQHSCIRPKGTKGIKSTYPGPELMCTFNDLEPFHTSLLTTTGQTVTQKPFYGLEFAVLSFLGDKTDKATLRFRQRCRPFQG